MKDVSPRWRIEDVASLMASGDESPEVNRMVTKMIQGVADDFGLELSDVLSDLTLLLNDDEVVLERNRLDNLMTPPSPGMAVGDITLPALPSEPAVTYLEELEWISVWIEGAGETEDGITSGWVM